MNNLYWEAAPEHRGEKCYWLYEEVRNKRRKLLPWTLYKAYYFGKPRGWWLMNVFVSTVEGSHIFVGPEDIQFEAIKAAAFHILEEY